MRMHILKRKPDSYYFGTAVAWDCSLWEHYVLVYGTSTRNWATTSNCSDYSWLFQRYELFCMFYISNNRTVIRGRIRVPFLSYNCLGRWPGSVVGIATGYGLDGPGIESQCGRDLPHLSRPPHPASCKLVTGSLPGVKSGKGMTLTPQPLLVPWSRKSRAIPSTPPMGRTACTEPPCLYKGAIYLTVWWMVHN